MYVIDFLMQFKRENIGASSGNQGHLFGEAFDPPIPHPVWAGSSLKPLGNNIIL